MTIALADTLIARAQAQTGLSDFGPQGWRQGLGELVTVMRSRDFGDVANARIEDRLTAVLASRLQIEDWIASHPQVLDEDITAPLFILGMPRTGTTALQAFWPMIRNGAICAAGKRPSPCPRPTLPPRPATPAPWPNGPASRKAAGLARMSIFTKRAARWMMPPCSGLIFAIRNWAGRPGPIPAGGAAAT